MLRWMISRWFHSPGSLQLSSLSLIADAHFVQMLPCLHALCGALVLLLQRARQLLARLLGFGLGSIQLHMPMMSREGIVHRCQKRGFVQAAGNETGTAVQQLP